ncbi:MAG: pseudouridylate synthase [Propionibacterium sp.]|nr:pseudouridylate synthase [Propionibacterium sp.]
MPPKSPLPPRHGLQAAWVRTPDRDPDNALPWPTMRDFLLEKLGPAGSEAVDRMLERGDFVDAEGRPWTGREIYRPHTFVWFHRELRDEAPVPGELTVIHRDERIVVFDKPHFLSTIPRGRHVVESAVVRGRRQLDLPELSAAHRLDRGTAGVLLMTTEQRWRAAYHSIFREPTTTKVYEAMAPVDPGLEFPRRVSSHLVKEVGVLQAERLDREPNAHTDIELVEEHDGWGRYEVRPITGKTHQIRMHFLELGIPLLNDPLYPEVVRTPIDDFSSPLGLVAVELGFVDPVDGSERRFLAPRRLAWPDVALWEA